MKKVVFITGTRADYGKLKSIILKLQSKNKIKAHLYVTGMHNLKMYGATYDEIAKDKIKNVKRFQNQIPFDPMDKIFSKTSLQFSNYIRSVNPDMIIVHGDRIESLACAIIGLLNNVKVGHIEGGELSGTVDEMIRHSISKISNYHFVTNKFAKKRLLQMGEKKSSIFIIGSPDVDIILRKDLPTLKKAKKRYGIKFDDYSIGILHPVTTDIKNLKKYSSIFVNSMINSGKKYILIYPNNDSGHTYILNSYKKLKNNSNFRIFSSLRFEYFLTFLKNANFIIGNSSAGIVEAPYYGTPCINLGNRQKNRANIKSVINSSFSTKNILNLINIYSDRRFKTVSHFGLGNSNKKFIDVLYKNNKIWDGENQKYFKEYD